MIYKSDSNGQWYRINPDFMPFDIHQNYVRRELFSAGIFRVDKVGDSYHLFVKDWSIGAWSPGDIARASSIIRSAFATYFALTRCKK